jgi:16S rRNA (cytidine1402-2'-O)-methyltransferase
MGILYLIGTPIGNTKDITFRASEKLLEATIILCEDTRKTAFLIGESEERFNKKRAIGQQLISFYEGNEEKRMSRAMELLTQGADIALVSNAGMPLISDPGFKLVELCLRSQIKVEVIPGPSAVTTALAISGMPTDKFMFIGFLSKKENKVKEIFGTLPEKTTIIFFESPFRVIKTFEIIRKTFGDISIVVCREMTKIHEEIRREKISQSIEYFTLHKPKGEFTCLFHLD